MDNISFNGQSYPIREISLEGYGQVTIGTTELEDDLFSEKNETLMNEAKAIDEKIFFYVVHDEIFEENLVELVSDYLK